ncbi:hypothetical protein Tco_0622356 [Tanacetum coccineum]
MADFKVLETQFQMFIKSQIYSDDESVSIDKRALHKREYASWVNERQMQTTEEKVDTSKALDANIRPIYDEEPMDKVQSTAEINVFTTRQQHTEQPEFNNEGEGNRFYNHIETNQLLENRLRLSLNDLEFQSHGLPPKLINNDLSKPVTTHYLPKEREYAVVKPHHVIASSESRNSSKNMPRFSSNDMVHNHYLDEAKKKTQECGRNSRPIVMPSAKSQSTANGSKPKPRSNTQTSRNWPASNNSLVTTNTVPIAEHSRNFRNFSDSNYFVCSTCQKCVFNANHDTSVTKFLNEVNSHAKVPSNKTTNRNKPVEQTSVAKKPERQILKGHRFSIKKTSVVHEKTMTLRSSLRWKPAGKIFKIVGLRWVPTGKILTSSTTKVDREPTNGSDEDITN